MIFLVFSIGCIIAGMVMAIGAKKGLDGVLAKILYWVGVALIIIGLLCLFAPIIDRAAAFFKSLVT